MTNGVAVCFQNVSFLVKGVGAPFLKARLQFAVFVFLLISLQSFAQIKQPARYEREHKSNQHDFVVVSMNEEGIAVIQDTEKFNDRKKTWEVVLLDSSLQEKHVLAIGLEDRLNLIGHDYHDQKLYVLFREGESDGGKLTMLQINPQTYSYNQYTINTELTIYLSHFNIIEDKAILAGYVSREPAVLLYNMSLNQTKVIPGFYLTDTEILDIRVNKNNTFNALLGGRTKSKKLVLKTFDATGTMLMDDVMEVDHDKTILTGITSILHRDELMIIGSWADGSNRMASGIFSVLADPFTEQKINYYDFVQMDHFIDYLGSKRVGRMKIKAERKRKQGKVPDFKTSLLPVRIEESKDGFVFLSEAYYSPYPNGNQRYNNYSNPANQTSPFYPTSTPYGYPYASRYGGGYPYSGYGPYGSMRSTYEIKMQQSSVSFFDSKGKFISDVGCSLDGLILPSKEQVSDFVVKPSQVSVVYRKDKELRVQVSDEDGGDVEQNKIQMELKSPDETIKSESDDIGNVRYWFGQNLYVWGNQTLKKSGDASRDVFYITKIKVP